MVKLMAGWAIIFLVEQGQHFWSQDMVWDCIKEVYRGEAEVTVKHETSMKQWLVVRNGLMSTIHTETVIASEGRNPVMVWG